jgi:hypothetical protein
MHSFDKLLDWFHFKSKPNMAEDFHPNNTVNHRYQNIERLQRALENRGFSPNTWKIRVHSFDTPPKSMD